jgi:hypothetical protein
MKLIRKYFFIFCLLPVLSVRGQQLEDLFKKAESQLRLNESPEVFLHLDKILYAGNEKIWFTAYFLDNRTPVDSLHTLHVVLVNDMSQDVVVSERYVLDKGVATGSIQIPDSIQTGDYSLIAYTNLFTSNPSSGRFFRQPIEIVGIKPPFQISFKEVGQAADDSILLTAKIIRARGSLPVNAELAYNLYLNGKEIETAKSKINAYGEVMIPATVHQLVQTLEIRGLIKEGKEQTWFKIPVLWESNDYMIKLLPESGQLIDGHPAKLFFQLLATDGKGMATVLELLEDGKSIRTFQSDIYGIGSIDFYPRKNSKYRISLQGDTLTKIIQHFPSVQASGFGISVQDTRNDTLRLALVSPQLEGPCVFTVHNNKEIISQLAVKFTAGKGKLSLPTKDWPEGPYTISLFDDKIILQTQNVINISHINSPVVTITTDSSIYHKRSKMTVKIRIKDRDGKPLQGGFSFNTTLRRTLKENFPDIIRFNYVDQFLPNNNVYPSFGFLKEANHWGYFVHQNMVNEKNKDADCYRGYKPAAFEGQVLYNDRKIKKSVELAIVSNGITTIKSDENGFFRLPPASLQGGTGTKVLVSVNVKNPVSYSIVFDSSLKKLNTLLAAQYFCLQQFARKDEASLQQKQEMQAAKGITLQAVVVESKNNDNYNSGGVYNSNACNDWVCMNGILNCRNHPTGTPPVEGQRYISQQGSVIYHCASNKKNNETTYFKILKPIYFNDVFPAADFSIPNDLVAPEILNRATLSWSPFIFTDENGEAAISFYTNDVKGLFVGMLQGVTNDGVMRGEVEFTVGE